MAAIVTGGDSGIGRESGQSAIREYLQEKSVWIDISRPHFGLHGTPDAASVGYSASHGCIRMRIPDAEWLFVHVRVGSPVWIIH